jgi:sugar phosphate isomerase/epimerase
MAKAMDFGVQSFCFRNFKDNTDVAGKVKQIGVDKIEVCGIHSGAFEDLGAWKNDVAIYQDAGVEIVSIGVQSFGEDMVSARRWFECAQAAGAKYISAHFQVGNFQTVVPKVAALCDEFGIRIAIHCHGGYCFGGSPDVIRCPLDTGGENIGVCLDTAWCMQIGPRQGKPIQWVKNTFKGRIYGVHYKDFTFGPDGMWEDVVVGTGNLDLPAFVTALNDEDFDGYAVIEYEADPENPVPALTECVTAVRAAGV